MEDDMGYELRALIIEDPWVSPLLDAARAKVAERTAMWQEDDCPRRGEVDFDDLNGLPCMALRGGIDDHDDDHCEPWSYILVLACAEGTVLRQAGALPLSLRPGMLVELNLHTLHAVDVPPGSEGDWFFATQIDKSLRFDYLEEAADEILENAQRAGFGLPEDDLIRSIAADDQDWYEDLREKAMDVLQEPYQHTQKPSIIDISRLDRINLVHVRGAVKTHRDLFQEQWSYLLVLTCVEGSRLHQYGSGYVDLKPGLLVELNVHQPHEMLVPEDAPDWFMAAVIDSDERLDLEDAVQRIGEAYLAGPRAAISP